jgi:urease gamma subunit
MWVRAVAVAVAMACAASAVQAKQYQEVWNPPEARHAVKAAKGHEGRAAGAKPVARKVAAKGGKVNKVGKAGKAQPRKVVAKTTLHTARQGKPHARLMAKSAAVRKPTTVAHAAPHPKGTHVVAQIKAKAVHPGAAGHVQTAALRAKPQKNASRSASTHPATAMARPSPNPTPNHPAATMANTTTQATAANNAAGSGNLPPILH